MTPHSISTLISSSSRSLIAPLIVLVLMDGRCLFAPFFFPPKPRPTLYQSYADPSTSKAYRYPPRCPPRTPSASGDEPVSLVLSFFRCKGIARIPSRDACHLPSHLLSMPDTFQAMTCCEPVSSPPLSPPLFPLTPCLRELNFVINGHLIKRPKAGEW
jgi:hypothetical protein